MTYLPPIHGSIYIRYIVLRRARANPVSYKTTHEAPYPPFPPRSFQAPHPFTYLCPKPPKSLSNKTLPKSTKSPVSQPLNFHASFPSTFPTTYTPKDRTRPKVYKGRINRTSASPRGQGQDPAAATIKAEFLKRIAQPLYLSGFKGKDRLQVYIISIIGSKYAIILYPSAVSPHLEPHSQIQGGHSNFREGGPIAETMGVTLPYRPDRFSIFGRISRFLCLGVMARLMGLL